MYKKWLDKKFLCSMEEVTGLVDGADIKDKNSETLYRTTFHHLFTPNGLPGIVIVDNGRDLKGVMTALCKLLYITFTPVYPDNHI